MDKKYMVEIRFGSAGEQSEIYESDDDWEEFSFDTEAELTAFMDGVAAVRDVCFTQKIEEVSDERE